MRLGRPVATGPYKRDYSGWVAWKLGKVKTSWAFLAHNIFYSALTELLQKLGQCDKGLWYWEWDWYGLSSFKTYACYNMGPNQGLGWLPKTYR